ncbi:hypothetical protein COOONC_18305 [Cooperia oncophora]
MVFKAAYRVTENIWSNNSVKIMVGSPAPSFCRQKVKPENRTELFELSGSYYILLARGPYALGARLPELKNHTPKGRWVTKEVSLSDVNVNAEAPTDSGAADGEKKTEKKSAMKFNTIHRDSPGALLGAYLTLWKHSSKTH